MAWDTPTTLDNIIERYGKPDPSIVGKLPRVTCKKCSDSPGRVCSEHAKVDCTKQKQPNRKDGWCGNWMTERHIHLDYVGHAETTKQLTEIDPTWTWEPMYDPPVTYSGNEATLWGRLTLLGATKPGVGTCDKGKHDEAKELTGDFLRNAAMRFGVNLSLWSKQEWEDAVDETPAPTSPPEDRIATTRERPAPKAPVGQSPVVSDEERAAAAAVVDPETNPGNALIAKFGSAAKAQMAARNYVKDLGEPDAPQPTTFDKLVEDFPELVDTLLAL